LTRHWRLVLASVLGGLLAGVWLGARLERAAIRRAHRGVPSPERMVKMLRRELGLRDDQASAVRKILESRRAAFAAIRRDEQSSMAALRVEIDKDLSPLLDDAQKTKLAELRARWEKHAKEPDPPLAR
jgi:hypothetical protein